MAVIAASAKAVFEEGGKGIGALNRGIPISTCPSSENQLTFNLFPKSFIKMRTTIHLIIGLSFFLLFTNCSKEEEIAINNVADFEEFIQEEIDYQNIPALSILVFEEDNILYENYFGQAHIEQNIALQKDHLFLMASVSKVITGTALLQLEEKGFFSLEEAINDYLPFEVNTPDYSTPITFRMLLTHTSGIADSDLMEDYYYGEDSPISLHDFLKSYLVSGGERYSSENFHDFEPGTAHEYSNTGTALEGLLVEEISGMDFNTYCQQNIFLPLGMTHTFWHLSEISQTIVQPYEYSNGNYEAIEHYTFTDYPNGGLRSTSRDLFKFLQAFLFDGTANNFELLQPETIQAMITPQIPSISADMGLQLLLLDVENNLWGHDGGEEGVSTIMGFNPTTKVGAIVLTNNGDADIDELLTKAYQLQEKL